MKRNALAKLWACSLGILLLCASPVEAQRITSPLQQQTYTRQEVLRELAKANVIYLGETHDSVKDHKAQLDIIRELHRKNPKIAIAMEMFQRPFQKVLNRYLAGELTEEQLVEQTEYNQRWGFPWEYYAPILRFALENQLPVLAINTPTEITRKVARMGLESLTEQERRYIPPFDEIRTDNAEYRQKLLEVFKLHAELGKGFSDGFDRFFLAQVVWDETMAEVIAQFALANPDYQIIVIAGQGHIQYGHGIPSRVQRRIGSENFLQRLILLNPAPEILSDKDKRIADYFWENAD
ncbi:MAG: ChaN family lipoprotein [Oscillatoriaceae bacterium SKW80]|nr:ChaN family lipoprotein [Oscillatoriaceae bacterium SKYG93]MCX8120086.1 ChaN family lipoprotein [Oscillatoriaceae bacterium SKW80]MDW8453012.1 ChaN family lipoprotein [Oscillatoriaceae cyanobacterium SKYGB_i_bin93]HIK29077.1 ChaN family lipoprotein [Oscillatoriaceae cyanobacterium M7585_C2015_266]